MGPCHAKTLWGRSQLGPRPALHSCLEHIATESLRAARRQSTRYRARLCQPQMAKPQMASSVHPIRPKIQGTSVFKNHPQRPPPDTVGSDGVRPAPHLETPRGLSLSTCDHFSRVYTIAASHPMACHPTHSRRTPGDASPRGLHVVRIHNITYFSDWVLRIN
jgi:hypothetical protein